MYVHHDLHPKRTFARLSSDGSVGEDLSVQTEQHDQACLSKYMHVPEKEHVHQATNSLAITMCRRADSRCVPDDTNTFIMSIYHHQTFRNWHAQYQPHVLLFQRSAPFSLHAISQKGIWVNGKLPLTNETESLLVKGTPLAGHLELFYITSISWKTSGQRYHGFVDDPLFLAFGIEDIRSGGIDVLAGDLLKDVSFCSDGVA
jgi:hypothetical protein